MKKKLNALFKNLCCSVCKEGFSENSITVKRDEKGLLVTHLTCQKCGKQFGVAFIGFSDLEVKDEDKLALNVIEGPDPISYDDVIEAHKFIQNLDENWLNYINKS